MTDFNSSSIDTSSASSALVNRDGGAHINNNQNASHGSVATDISNETISICNSNNSMTTTTTTFSILTTTVDNSTTNTSNYNVTSYNNNNNNNNSISNLAMIGSGHKRTSAEQYAAAAAAAAARRKRRRALVRRNNDKNHHHSNNNNNNNIQGPSSTANLATPGSGSLSDRMCSPAASISLSPPSSAEHTGTGIAISNTAVPYRVPEAIHPQTTTSATSTTTPTSVDDEDFPCAFLVQPTVVGVQDLAWRLRCGEAIAVPTECTYEIMTQLSFFENNNTTNNSPFQRPICNETIHHLNPITEHPWIERIRTQYPSFLTRNDSAFVGSSFAGQTAHRHQNPHVYIPSAAAIEQSSYLHHLLPKKHYALRDTDGKVMAVHTFNETLSVLKLFAAKLWPGPVVLYAAVTVPTPVTVQRQGKEYVALRSPCHPLAVKVHQEYKATGRLGNRQAKLHHESHQECSQPHEVIRLEDEDTSHEMTASTELKKCSEVSKTARSILVGFPMMYHDADRQLDTFVTEASTVPKIAARRASRTTRSMLSPTTTCPNTPPSMSGTMSHTEAALSSLSSPMAVLHGEERQEILCVPTCEHGQPWPVSLWFDASTRTVTVLHSSNNNNNNKSGKHDTTTSITTTNFLLMPSNLLQVLRFRPKSNNEQVVQAVLAKWKVVQVEE